MKTSHIFNSRCSTNTGKSRLGYSFVLSDSFYSTQRMSSISFQSNRRNNTRANIGNSFGDIIIKPISLSDLMVSTPKNINSVCYSPAYKSSNISRPFTSKYRDLSPETPINIKNVRLPTISTKHKKSPNHIPINDRTDDMFDRKSLFRKWTFSLRSDPDSDK